MLRAAIRSSYGRVAGSALMECRTVGATVGGVPKVGISHATQSTRAPVTGLPG